MNTLNTWAALISFPFTFINLEIILAFKFMAAHHDVIWKIAVMSGCSCLGQMFIFLCVVEFGTLTTSIITTLRKFFTLLGSALIFGDSFDSQKKIGAGIVFFGIVIDLMFKKKEERKKEHEVSAEMQPLVLDSDEEDEHMIFNMEKSFSLDSLKRTSI